MRDQPTENPNCPLSDLKVLILHAIKQHEQVFVSTNERIELRIQMFEHRYSNPILIICGRSHKEAMQQFVDDALDVWTNL